MLLVQQMATPILREVTVPCTGLFGREVEDQRMVKNHVHRVKQNTHGDVRMTVLTQLKEDKYEILILKYILICIVSTQLKRQTQQPDLA